MADMCSKNHRLSRGIKNFRCKGCGADNSTNYLNGVEYCPLCIEKLNICKICGESLGQKDITISIRSKSVKYLAVTYIERAFQLYKELFTERKEMTVSNAREYLDLYTEYEVTVETLSKLGIYNWLSMEGKVLRERDIEIK